MSLEGEEEGQNERAQAKAKNGTAKLKFEKKNQSMAKLLPNMTVERRPLLHAPIASPFAGADVQKVVYVSRHSPLMAVVKRVKKLLLHVEKRAMQGVDLTKDPKNGMKKLAEASEKLGKNGESVLVKASGRAMDQALRVGDWFRDREDELACNVVVRTGSVQAIDDIVAKEADDDDDGDEEVENENTAKPHTAHSHQDGASVAETMDTSLTNAKTHHDTTMTLTPVQSSEALNNSTVERERGTDDSPAVEERVKKRNRRGKRKRAFLNEDVSARIRWVNTVEVAISLKG